MENYPGNSRHPKKAVPAKKVEKVIQGEASLRKKPLGKRFTETFVQGNAKSVWGYVMWEVLTPALKDTFADMVTQGVERSLYGEARSRTRRGHSGSNGYVQYNKPQGFKSDPRSSLTPKARATHDFGEIELATRVEANTVIERLYDIVSTYEVATVKDLYEMVGITSDYTDEKWGWTDLSGTEPVRTRDGSYILSLPRPQPID